MKITIFWISLVMCLANVFSECIWNVNHHLPKKDPILLRRLRGHFELYKPNSIRIELRPNQVLYASCTGKNNIADTNKSSVKLSCVSGTTVLVNNKTVDVSTLGCSKNVVASVQVIPTASNALSVGFRTDFGWLGLYDIKYNYVTSTPEFVRHVIYGSNLEGSFTNHGDRPNFKTDGAPIRINWTEAYHKKNQRQVLTSLLGSKKAEKYLNQTFLSKGHLAPDADFYFHSWKTATYFYVNVVPTWQTINAGNWLRIENAVRKKAKDSKEVLTISTGVQGVLRFDGKALYLHAGEVAVPKYIWKVVCNKTDKCIAFVVVNNPFFDDSEVVCRDLCRGRQAHKPTWGGWCFSSYDQYVKGKVFFCDVEELKNKKQYKYLLYHINVDGILDY